MSTPHLEPHRVHQARVPDLWTPPHPPRRPSALYRLTHRTVIVQRDSPCLWCGVRHSILQDPGIAGRPSALNPRGARQMELHHHPVERSLIHACSPEKLARFYPAITSRQAMLRWIDSEEATLPLCDCCHRGPFGIHHVAAVCAAVHPYLLDHYLLAVGRDPTWEAAQDAALVQAAGLEPAPGDPA